MKAAQCFLPLALLAASASAADTALPDSAIVDSTIAALEAGDTDELNWLVTEVGGIQFPRPSYFERGEIFELLQGCTAEEDERVSYRHFVLYRFEWDCGEQNYVGRLAHRQDDRTVAIVDFYEKSEFEANLLRLPSIMAPPPPIVLSALQPSSSMNNGFNSPETLRMKRKVQIADVFAQSFLSGDLSALTNRFSTHQDIRYGFQDSHGDTLFVDKVWHVGRDLSEGVPALTQASEYVRTQLGQPNSATCKPSGRNVECLWQFAEESTRLTARIHVFREDTHDWGFRIFEFRYQTAAMLLEAERRAED